MVSLPFSQLKTYGEVQKKLWHIPTSWEVSSPKSKGEDFEKMKSSFLGYSLEEQPKILRIFQHTETYPRPQTNGLWRNSFHLGV